MIAFCIGFVCGVGVLAVVALWFARKPTPQAKPQHNGISAVSVDLSGNSATMDAAHAHLLKQVLKGVSDNKLFEIPRGQA